MKVEGTKEFDAPAQLVWDVLNDPSKMAKLLPGVESFEIQDDRHWKAAVKIPLGMGGLKLNFKFEKLEERPIEYAKLSSKGQGVGAIVAMETEFNLKAEGDRTHMDWVGRRPRRRPDREHGPAGLPADRQPAGRERAERARGAGAEAKGGGSSGAEEGIHAASPEAYSSEPEGPTHSADD